MAGVLMRRLMRLRWRLSAWLFAFGVRNKVARYMIVHWLLGIGTGFFCAGMLLLINPIGFRTLLLRSDAAIPALILLFGGFAVTFGGVVCAAAVMFPREDEDRGTKAPVGPTESGLARAPVAR